MLAQTEFSTYLGGGLYILGARAAEVHPWNFKLPTGRWLIAIYVVETDRSLTRVFFLKHEIYSMTS